MGLIIKKWKISLPRLTNNSLCCTFETGKKCNESSLLTEAFCLTSNGVRVVGALKTIIIELRKSKIIGKCSHEDRRNHNQKNQSGSIFFIFRLWFPRLRCSEKFIVGFASRNARGHQLQFSALRVLPTLTSDESQVASSNLLPIPLV